MMSKLTDEETDEFIASGLTHRAFVRAIEAEARKRMKEECAVAAIKFDDEMMATDIPGKHIADRIRELE